ncbi:hypothetical protein RRG08_020658 [Elysia crispata]|uniref:Uncharacterized protein n=1 Tax=Elysia crispata TaxID=231223 RepID=A0AAE0Z4E6_9GAST|nr:hypothetical protein RRG08_020658 [Elysia crispata]
MACVPLEWRACWPVTESQINKPVVSGYWSWLDNAQLAFWSCGCCRGAELVARDLFTQPWEQFSRNSAKGNLARGDKSREK